MDKEFDKLYSEVVKHSTCGIFVKYGHTDGILELTQPLVFVKEYYRPWPLGWPLMELHLIGVDCMTGELITREDKHLRYNQLTLEEMTTLHTRVVQQKQYSFIINHQLV